jgi:hypothetical protein
MRKSQLKVSLSLGEDQRMMVAQKLQIMSLKSVTLPTVVAGFQPCQGWIQEILMQLFHV